MYPYFHPHPYIFFIVIMVTQTSPSHNNPNITTLTFNNFIITITFQCCSYQITPNNNHTHRCRLKEWTHWVVDRGHHISHGFHRFHGSRSPILCLIVGLKVLTFSGPGLLSISKYYISQCSYLFGSLLRLAAQY